MENITNMSIMWTELPTDNDTGFTNVSIENTTDIPPLYLRVPEWSRVVAKTFIAAMCVVGIFGNIVLIIALQKKKIKKRSSTDNYVICLAAGDIVTLLYNCPVDYLRFTPDLWERMGTDWMCKLHFYIHHGVALMSLILIFGIGVDRFYKVFRPHTSAFLLEKASKRVCFAAIGTSVIFSIFFLFTSHQNPVGICKLDPKYSSTNGAMYIIYNAVSLSLSIVLGCIYVKIAMFLKRRENERQRRAPTNGHHNLTASDRQLNDMPLIVQHDLPQSDRPFDDIPVEPPISVISSNATLTQGQGIATGTAVRQDNPRPGLQPVTRTTITMSLITAVLFVTTVLPVIALGIFSFVDGHSETAYMVMFFTVRLPLIGNVANPILFVISSSEFRGLIKQMFMSFCVTHSIPQA